MQTSKLESGADSQKFQTTKFRSSLREHNIYKVPKIANKQIPLHNFGLTFDNFSLQKHHRCRSKVWHINQSNRSKNLEISIKTTYNRPVHLLKEYLQRKQKYMVHPIVPTSQLDSAGEIKEKQFFKTANEFRIRKNNNKKALAVYPQQQANENEEQMQTTQLGKDKDFTFYNNKNLYDMSLDQLQRSIEWKKSFLDMLNHKYRVNKARDVLFHR